MDSLDTTAFMRFLADNSTDSKGSCFSENKDCGGGDNSLWYVGVIVSILGSIMSNFGVNTQKYSLIQEIKCGRKRAYVKQPIWVVGLLLVVLGAVFDFAALGFAAQSLITPVGGFTMVANLFFASYWLGERITRLDLASTALIILGVILVAAFADKSKQCFTLEDLICLYRRTDFIVYAVLIILTIISAYIGITVVRKRVVIMREEGLQDTRLFSKYKTAYPLLCAFLSGIIGAQSVLFAKSTIEILKSTARGNNEFTRFGTYLIIIFMFVAIFGQIHWLTVGLKEFDAVIMVPVFQCVFVLFTIIGGAAYFGEFRNFSLIQTIMFTLGVLVLVLGVLGLAMHESRSAEELLSNDEAAKRMEDEEATPPDLRGISISKASSSSSGTAGTEALPPVEDASQRRESISRFDEFNRMTPYGALTGRFTPALFFYNEMEHHSFFLRHHQSDPDMHSDEPKRRRSVPHRSPAPTGPAPSLRDLEKGVSELSLVSQRSSRGQSFSGVQKLLSYGTGVGKKKKKKKDKDKSTKIMDEEDVADNDDDDDDDDEEDDDSSMNSAVTNE